MMRRTTFVRFSKYIPENSAYPCFMQDDNKNKTYTSQDIADSLKKRIDAMMADPNVMSLDVSLHLQEVCHEMQIVDSGD